MMSMGGPFIPETALLSITDFLEESMECLLSLLDPH